MIGMAILHKATIEPTKLELIAGWLPARSWYPGEEKPEVERVAAFRFDDPAGEVGVETLIVRAGDGLLVQVPLTYRGAPLEGADRWLVGTTEHSVLGQRWVYDACGDPVYVSLLAGTIFTGVGQAEEMVQSEDGTTRRRDPDMTVSGSGAGAAPEIGQLVSVEETDPTVIVTDTVELTVVRLLDRELGDAGLRLTGSWKGQQGHVLAYARER